MKILGIDTSTSCGSIGLIDDGSVISEYLLNTALTHSERLLRSIEYVLNQGGCSTEDLDGWALSIGPGSFTGLRIGVSTVKGLAFASHKPVAGVPTLDALAANISPTPYLICPVLDARKGELYTSCYRYGRGDILKRLTAYEAIRPEDLAKRIEEKTVFLGSGVKSYGDTLRKAIPTLATFVPDPFNQPRGSVVARLGLERLREE